MHDEAHYGKHPRIIIQKLFRIVQSRDRFQISVSFVLKTKKNSCKTREKFKETSIVETHVDSHSLMFHLDSSIELFMFSPEKNYSVRMFAEKINRHINDRITTVRELNDFPELKCRYQIYPCNSPATPVCLRRVCKE